MRRSTVINHSNNENSKRKRSLEETNSITKSKKRRHLSPNHMNSSIRKRKSKTRSSSNNSSKQKKKKNRTSSRHVYSIEHLNEITLPNWECISPNIDQILSNKHTQSGVYAHEVHLVQQELEALLSMSILRENILNDLLHPTIISNNQENIRSKILQHKEAENVYTSKKKLPIKPLPPLINHQQQQQQQQQYRANGPHLLLDRQVSMTPIIGARIDKIWSDINLYYRRISSNDILSIENLIQFNQQLENKLQQYKNNHLTQTNIIEKLNEENFHELLNITQINSLTTHYIDRTTIGRFQTKLYEHIPQTSPVYKTPISSPFYRKSLGNYLDKTPLLRSSPRLNRLNHFSLSNLKSIADPEQSSSIKSQTKTKGSSLDPSINLQERIQSVRDYLTDQHPLINEQQTFQDIKSTKRRKTSLTTTTTNHCTDIFQSKLLTLITLLHECSTISLCALKRARLQSNNEQIWQKLNTIEHDLELLIEKLDMFDSNENNNNNINMEKLFQTLENLLNDWNKYENDFNNQLEQFDSLCQQ